jgi:hypothetical protein
MMIITVSNNLEFDASMFRRQNIAIAILQTLKMLTYFFQNNAHHNNQNTTTNLEHIDLLLCGGKVEWRSFSLQRLQILTITR